MSNWNDLTRDRLITEYRKFPCLWSTRDGDAKNAEKRKESLGLITDELNKHEEKPFTQEEVRTQFKNLRDMYRRKRKKLQSQQEVNPAAAVDEPGWIYFARLKFLDDTVDFGPPNESPPPPPKKRKTAVSARPTDDASLPTPLEEGVDAMLALAQVSSAAEPMRTSPAVERKLVKQEATTSEKKQEAPVVEEAKGECVASSSSQQAEAAAVTASGEKCVEEQQQQKKAEPSSSSSVQAPPQKEQQKAIECHQQPQAVLLTTATTSRETRQSVEPPPPVMAAENEFDCFGRFVAVTLKKLAARSPIGALEARKQISDVLYRAELDALPR